MIGVTFCQISARDGLYFYHAIWANDGHAGGEPQQVQGVLPKPGLGEPETPSSAAAAPHWLVLALPSWHVNLLAAAALHAFTVAGTRSRHLQPLKRSLTVHRSADISNKTCCVYNSYWGLKDRAQ